MGVEWLHWRGKNSWIMGYSYYLVAGTYLVTTLGLHRTKGVQAWAASQCCITDATMRLHRC